MSGGSEPDRSLEGYRERADSFLAELEEETYRHFAGLKPELELAAIHDRYDDLTSLEQARSIGERVNGAGPMRELWRFACEGYLGAATRAEDEHLATLEAGLEVKSSGERIAFRMLGPEIANSGDRERRARLEQARSALVEQELNPIMLELRARLRTATLELGGESAVDLYRRFGSTTWPRKPARSWPRPRASTSARWSDCSSCGLGFASTRWRASTRRGSSGPLTGTAPSRPGACSLRSRGRWPAWASTCAASRTWRSTSPRVRARRRAPSARRSRSRTASCW
jgi:hypothetical protein